MEEAPRGVRRPEEEELYRGPNTDPLVQTDMVSPAVEGYFRLPAIWVGEMPASGLVIGLNPQVHHQVVMKQTLKAGIEVWVQRDGMFLFDFSRYSLAPQVIIPGFRKPNANGPYRRPVATEEAERQAEEHAILRAQIMNVHQACLTTAERIVMRRSAMMGFPITSWSSHKALTLTTSPSYYDDTENLHALGQNTLNNKDHVKRDAPLGRRTIELPVIAYSLTLLDDILLRNDAGVIQVVEGAYMSACRSRERRYGESLVLAWGVCEQAVSREWGKMINSAGEDQRGRMPKERRDKLKGRDYTASIMIESLELLGRISHDLYRSLEISRKARNKWMHEMRVPKESEVSVAIRAMEQLLLSAWNINLQLQTGGRGGVPQWGRWIWNQFQGR